MGSLGFVLGPNCDSAAGIDRHGDIMRCVLHPVSKVWENRAGAYCWTLPRWLNNMPKNSNNNNIYNDSVHDVVGDEQVFFG